MIVWKLDALMRQRRARGRQMAKRMGIGENYLSRVRHEVPDRLSLALLDSLCRELDCTIADLLEYRPSAEPPQVAIAELHQEVTPVRRRTRRAPSPAPVAAPVPEPVAPPPQPVAPPEPAPVSAPAVQTPPTPVAPPAPTPPRERPVLPLMAPLPGTPKAPAAQPAPTPAPVVPEPPAAEEAEGDPSASEATAHYVRMDALQARLDRLRRRR